MREKLTYIVGRVEDFNALDIPLTTERRSLDGTLVIRHKELLDSEDLNKILVDVMQYKSPFFFLGDSAMEALMQTPEWSEVE